MGTLSLNSANIYRHLLVSIHCELIRVLFVTASLLNRFAVLISLISLILFSIFPFFPFHSY